MIREQIIFGVHAVDAALRYDPSHVKALWVDAGRRDARLARIRQAAAEHGVPVHDSTRRELAALVGDAHHQGVAARYEGLETAGEGDLEWLLDGLREPPFLLVLDGVQDPHNLGACLRTAAAAGVHAVIAPRDRAARLTPTVRKVSCGAAEMLPFVQVTNLSRTLRQLKARGIWLVGAAPEAERDLYRADLTGALAVVLGSEQKGLRRLTREHCDVLVRIPMAGGMESLNVSVSAGVVLYEAVRQRSGSAGGGR